MPFSPETRIKLLFKSCRRCCICWKFCGSKIEVHHIIQESNGGSNDEDNGIPLCFDCHADVGNYNDNHPKGTKFQPSELRAHRDRLFRSIEEKGPLVFDALAHEVFLLSEEALIREETEVAFTPVNLEHDAKVARYLRYIRGAEDCMRTGKFGDAIRHFEAAFVVAESDTELDDYAQGGNYYQRKILLWECYLEQANRGSHREQLRAAFNMAINENTIRETYIREQSPSIKLNCRDYFYLLLQEKLFLFDDEIRNRSLPEQRLKRIAQLMDLIENPHRPGHSEDIKTRAKHIELEVVGGLSGIDPNLRYTRSDSKP